MVGGSGCLCANWEYDRKGSISKNTYNFTGGDGGERLLTVSGLGRSLIYDEPGTVRSLPWRVIVHEKSNSQWPNSHHCECSWDSLTLYCEVKLSIFAGKGAPGIHSRMVVSSFLEGIYYCCYCGVEWRSIWRVARAPKFCSATFR